MKIIDLGNLFTILLEIFHRFMKLMAPSSTKGTRDDFICLYKNKEDRCRSESYTAFNSNINVCIIENNARCIPTKFQGDLQWLFFLVSLGGLKWEGMQIFTKKKSCSKTGTLNHWMKIPCLVLPGSVKFLGILYPKNNAILAFEYYLKKNATLP